MIIKGTKEESKLIRWLQRATDAERENLSGFYVADGVVVAADGFQLYAAPTPDCLKELDGQIVKGKVASGDFVADMEQVEGKYPDFHQVMPHDPPEFAIAMSPRLLADALSGMKDARMVILRFWTRRSPVEVCAVGDERYALIMPMHAHDETIAAPWRPQSKAQKSADAEMREQIERKLADAEAELANQELANASSN